MNNDREINRKCLEGLTEWSATCLVRQTARFKA